MNGQRLSDIALDIKWGYFPTIPVSNAGLILPHTDDRESVSILYCMCSRGCESILDQMLRILLSLVDIDNSFDPEVANISVNSTSYGQR